MEIIVDNLCLRGADNFCNSLNISFFYTFYTLEMGKQDLFGLRTDALDVVELRLQGVFRALVTVERDGETVYLVLQSGEHMKQFAVGLQLDAAGWKTIEQLVGAMAVVLGQSGNGDIKVQLVLDDLADHLHLSLSAIGYDEVGKGLFFS